MAPLHFHFWLQLIYTGFYSHACDQGGRGGGGKSWHKVVGRPEEEDKQ